MGITGQGLDFLVSAKHRGVDFTRAMTIGRQYLLVPRHRLEAVLSTVDGVGSLSDVPAEHGFADELLRYLGADEVCSVDGSPYEGATHIHDLNTALPRSLAQRFSVVIDGGCLEHVFDVATALRSCMEMVEVGGHLLCMCPVNNAAGHGFYQFSPELYFRALSPENGFSVERMLLAEVHRRAPWYEVIDSAVSNHRIEFTTKRQAYLYVQARRLDDRPPLLVAPVESDYAYLWEQADVTGGGAPDPAVGGAGRRAVSMVKEVVRRHPALCIPIRRSRRLIARCRGWRRHRYSPRQFRRLGRHLG